MTKQTWRSLPPLPDKDYEQLYMFAEHYGMTVSQLEYAISTEEIKILNTFKGTLAFTDTEEEIRNKAKKHGLSRRAYLRQILMEEYVAIHKA